MVCLTGYIASMTIVNAIKPLLSSSPLFFPQNGTKLKNAKGKQKMGRKAALKQMVKVGTGGTLDPLADGVLGELCPLADT